MGRITSSFLQPQYKMLSHRKHLWLFYQATFFLIYFLFEGKFLYNVIMVSAIQQHKSAIIIHIAPPSSHPSHPSRFLKNIIYNSESITILPYMENIISHTHTHTPKSKVCYVLASPVPNYSLDETSSGAESQNPWTQLLNLASTLTRVTGIPVLGSATRFCINNYFSKLEYALNN